MLLWNRSRSIVVKRRIKSPNYQHGDHVNHKIKGKRGRTISDAVLIKTATGLSFAYVVRDIRAHVKPENMAVDIRVIKTTHQGDVLLKLGATSENKTIFGEGLQKTIKDTRVVPQMVSRAQIEMSDLDLKDRAKRCFRCFDYGHIVEKCKGVDRSRQCWKCGT